MAGSQEVPPIIAVSGLPRVGSMWTLNVCRALIRAAGLDTVPADVPSDDDEMLAAAKEWREAGQRQSRCVIKVHYPLDPMPGLNVIYNTRDLRDRIFSMCRFMKRELTEESANLMVRRSFAMDAHYAAWPKQNLLLAPYESIDADSETLIGKIASFMELPELKSEAIRNVADSLSKKSVRLHIREMEKRMDAGSGGDKRLEIVAGDGGSRRVYDRNTGFQSGHISDYEPGDWQFLWTNDQKIWIDQAIDAVRKESNVSDMSS